MKFDKPIMTTSELRKMGFSERFLETAYRTHGQRFAFKRPGGRKIFWDTEKFGKYVERHY